jgi:hypothetical protein
VRCRDRALRTSDSFSLILRSSGDMGGHISRDIVGMVRGYEEFGRCDAAIAAMLGFGGDDIRLVVYCNWSVGAVQLTSWWSLSGVSRTADA